MLVFWVFLGVVLNINLGLLAIYVSEGKLMGAIEEWSGISKGWGFRKFQGVKLNFLFCLYYVFMMKELFDSQDRSFLLFLLILGNRLFRS